MKERKQTVLSAILFFMVFLSLSFGLIAVGWRVTLRNDDRKMRASHAGTIDTVFVGSSILRDGIDPRQVDRELGVCSYNLSHPLLSWRARYYLLREELARNPVKDVYIEISWDSLSLEERWEGAIYIFPALSSLKERAAVTLDVATPENAENIFRTLLSDGNDVLREICEHGSAEERSNYADYALKGFGAYEAVDVSLREDEIVSSYRSDHRSLRFRRKSLYFFDKMISLCREYGITPILFGMPIADSTLWIADEIGLYEASAHELAEKYHLTFWDFNLLLRRYSLFNDRNSYLDGVHFCESAAHVMTDEFIEAIRRNGKGQPVDDLFYASYAQMLADSPYMAYYNDVRSKDGNAQYRPASE